MQQRVLISALTLALFWAAPSHAQWYVGAGIGESAARLDAGVQSASRFTAQGFASAQTGLDKRDTAGRVYGGYQFLPHFAVEAGFADLGQFGIHTTTVGGTGSLNNDLKVSAADLSIVGSLRRNNWTLFGRVGGAASEVKSSVSAAGAIALFGSDSASHKKYSTKFTYGVGAEYWIAEKVSIRGEWSRYEKVKMIDAVGAERSTSVDLYTLGAVYHF